MTVIGDEPQRPYDRFRLSDWFTTRDAQALTMDPAVWDDPRITGDGAEALDRGQQAVALASVR